MAVQKAIIREDLLGNVKRMGVIFESNLRRHIAPLPLVGDIRGRGLFWAVEFVMNKETNQEIPPEAKFCTKVVDIALDMGLSILGNLGKTGLYDVEHVIICPPYIVTEEEVVMIVGLLGQAIDCASRAFFLSSATKYLDRPNL